MKRLAVVAMLALAACNPYLQQQSVAPPGRTARLEEVNGFWALKRYRLELSEGVALALTCNRGAPCEHMTVTSDDPAIAEVRLASLASLVSSNPYNVGLQRPAAAFVIVGKAPGTTRVRVSAHGNRDVIVTVKPAT